MKIVDAGYEILDPLNGEEILKKIERVARVCYKSEDKITEGSAEKMVRALIKSNHMAMLEHYSFSVKEILIFNYKQSAESVKDLVAYQKKVLRHEIVHAFLYESGLWQNAYGSKCWAKNEEMIDWMAIQIPKIQRAYKEAYCDE